MNVVTKKNILNTPLGAEKNVEMLGIMAFPRIQSFYSMLMDRLHMVLGQFFLDKDFTLLVNAIPRDHEVGTVIHIPREEPLRLAYVGIKKQRELLEGPEEERIVELDEFWDKLDLFIGTEGSLEVPSKYFLAFREGRYRLEDIKNEGGFGCLADYFAPFLFPDRNLKPNNEWQEYEFKILQYHFYLVDYWYLSLPLIQFAEFDGVVQIIFHRSDLKHLTHKNKTGDLQLNERAVGNIIKAFSREYEGLILDWDIAGGGEQKRKILADALQDKIYQSIRQQEDNLNPILKELGYQAYYRKHQRYFEKRVKYGEEIPLTIRKQYHRIAIMSILIDSYAHNISAHSLTTLEWWFKQRAQLIKERKHGHDFEDDYPNLPVIQETGRNLEDEIHPLLRLLLDKGAFWSGLTRETNFGGKISSLHSVLWYDFINNPLYLGTIAFSEGILRLNVNITFLKAMEKKEGIALKKEVLLDGEFANIDLSRFYDPEKSPRSKDYSHFVQEGAKFKEIEKKLKEFRGFFPGGVVGRHAFFTILENEIRNVKHFSPEIIEQMQKEGLTLNLSIEEDNYRTDSKPTYFKIGVWIKKPVSLSKGLIDNRLQKLNGEITEGEDHQPRLGGIFQDKVCAAMLFNNAFSSVQDDEVPSFERYYPWVKAGSSYQLDFKTGDVIEEFEISARRYFKPAHQNSRKYFDDHYQDKPGYYKKFFHIWKGETIYRAEAGKEKLSHQLENLSRFRFIYLPADDIFSFIELRESGIFRIIFQQTDFIEDAYRQWLRVWLKGAPSSYAAYLMIKPKKEGEEEQLIDDEKTAAELAAQIDFDGENFYYCNKEDLMEYGRGLDEPEDFQELHLAHGEGVAKIGVNFCRFRSHGILKRHYLDGQNVHQAKMKPTLAAELLEVLATRICIFDNRIANRLEKTNNDIYRTELLCNIYKEDTDAWAGEKAKGFFRHHFLIVHLSFIETLGKANGEKKYSEKNISSFIDEEILNGQKPPDNFILVITTGRGRTHWWSKLKELDDTLIAQAKFEKLKPKRLPYTAFVTFRPVESLIAAVENSLSIKDDIELKYRLVKILFGS